MIGNLRWSVTAASLAAALLAVLTLGLVPSARAVTFFNDGAVHNVTSQFTAPITIADGGTPSHGTTVNLLSGSTVIVPTFASVVGVDLMGTSTLNMLGGRVESFTGIEAMDSSGGPLPGGTVNLYSGRVFGGGNQAITAGPGSVVNLYGGEIDGTEFDVVAQGAIPSTLAPGRVNLFGGVNFGPTSLGTFSLLGGGNLYIYGKNFFLDGAPAAFGPLAHKGTVTGVLADGSSVYLQLNNVTPSGVILVAQAPAPEPATAVLAGLAVAGLGLHAVRRGRKASAG